MGGGRAIGVSFLFGDFLFGQAKRKSLGPRQRLEIALFLAAGIRNSSQASQGAEPNGCREHPTLSPKGEGREAHDQRELNRPNRNSNQRPTSPHSRSRIE